MLIVDDEPGIRQFCRLVLQAEGMHCDEADDGLEALEAVSEKALRSGAAGRRHAGHERAWKCCRQLRETPPCPHLKIIMFSGQASPDEMAQMLLAGADDYLTKPFSIIQLQGTVKAALRLKDAQDRSDLLNQHLLTVNAELERNLTPRDSDLVQARNALVLALAKLVEHRDTETGGHLDALAALLPLPGRRSAANLPTFAGQIDAHFIEMLECCCAAARHRQGRPARSHPAQAGQARRRTSASSCRRTRIIGADTLKEVAKQHGFGAGVSANGHRHRPPSSRALRRHRLSRSPGGQRHSPGRPHRGHLATSTMPCVRGGRSSPALSHMRRCK